MDCRPINTFVDPWRVRYVSLQSLSLILRRILGHRPEGSLFERKPRWSLGVQILSQDQNSYVPMKSRIYGYTTETRPGFCDKASMGICLSGHYFRLANTLFCHKTSNGPLSVLTDAILRQMSKRRRVDGCCYVDDFLFSITAAEHSSCAGLAGGCPDCLRAEPKGTARTEVHIRHVGPFASAAQRKGDPAGPARGVHGGNRRHAPFAVPLRKFIGAPANDEQWDAARGGLEEVQRVIAYLRPRIPTLVKLGAPIWPTEASTLYHG